MHVLMIEDDRVLCEAMKVCLERAGYQVDLCYDGSDGLKLAQEGAYDILLIDRMLPGLDGTLLISSLRKKGNSTPALMLTALGGIKDRVCGLDAGADDYLTKPFAEDELLARLRALGRRPADFLQTQLLNWHDMTLNLVAKTLSGPIRTCTISAHECALLEAFFRAKGNTVPRSVLFTRVWGADAQVEDGNLDNYVHFLRRRLKKVGSSASLKTTYGVGYRLEVPPC
ncbi:MAG: response regulator transcription factor [Clostridia bacterium]